jgi:hypothetical protein
MHVKFAAFAALPLLFSYSGCDVADLGMARFNRDFHYNYPLQAGGRLSLESFNGNVEITAWDQNTVDISGTKYGPSEDAADALRIDIANSPDSVNVRVIRPGDFRGNRGARFAVKVPRGTVLDQITTSNATIDIMGGSGPGRFRTSNGKIQVRFFAGDVDARTSNGEVDLSDVEGQASAHTSNGRINAFHIRKSLQASTSNGPITANLTAGPAEGPFRLETSNGPIDLRLSDNLNGSVRAQTSNGPITVQMPGTLNARVSARTSNASVSSDFPVKIEGELNKNHMDGLIGNGGPLLDLSTSNGPIRLMRM